MQNQDSFEFQLSTPIKIHGVVNGKNDFIDCETLYLQGPTFKHSSHTIKLKKLFIEALFSMTQNHNKDELKQELDSEENSDDSNDSGYDVKAILLILFSAKGFDITDFFNKFSDFLCSGICFKDSDYSKRIKPTELEKISFSDREKLIGEYIEFFFIVSWMETFK